MKGLLQLRQWGPIVCRRFSSELQWSYVSCPSSKPLVNATIGQIVDKSALEFGNRDAFVSVHQLIKKSFAEVREDVTSLSAGFSAMGLKPGDRIGIWGPNSYEWYLTKFASMRAGLILVNINPAYQPNELEYCLNKVGVKAIVSAESFKTQDYFSMLSGVVPEIPSSKPGQISSEKVPSLRDVIMISDKEMG